MPAEDGSGSFIPHNPPKRPTRIKNDREFQDILAQLNNYKLEKLYYSLCMIRFSSHAPFLFVGAWAFIESLCRACGSNTDFVAFFSNQKLHDLGVNKEDGKNIPQALRRISDSGNTTKHNQLDASFGCEQLENDIDCITPVLKKLIQSKVASG